MRDNEQPKKTIWRKGDADNPLDDVNDIILDKDANPKCAKPMIFI
jgi:hypothetical protein